MMAIYDAATDTIAVADRRLSLREFDDAIAAGRAAEFMESYSDDERRAIVQALHKSAAIRHPAPHRAEPVTSAPPERSALPVARVVRR